PLGGGVAHERPPLLGNLGGEHVSIPAVRADGLGYLPIPRANQLDVERSILARVAVEREVARLGGGHPGEALPPAIARRQGAGGQGETSSLACKDDEPRAIHPVIAGAAAPAPLVGHPEKQVGLVE